MKRFWCARIIFPLPDKFSGSDLDAAMEWITFYQSKIEERQAENKPPTRFKIGWLERILFAWNFAKPMGRIRKGKSPNGECYFAVRPVRELIDLAWKH